jgi:hypothetical protein
MALQKIARRSSSSTTRCGFVFAQDSPRTRANSKDAAAPQQLPTGLAKAWRRAVRGVRLLG